MRFLPPTDQKCAESSTYWQFFYYRPPVKYRFTHLGEIVKMSCPKPNIYIYDALDNRYGFSMSVQHGIDCTIFHSFFSWKVWKKKVFLNFQKLAGLGLVGEVDNHVAIYGSKVAEGFSAFQRRSCLSYSLQILYILRTYHVLRHKFLFLPYFNMAVFLRLF